VYRDEREVDEWKLRDPIARFRKHLIETGRWSEAQEQALAATLIQEILQAVEAAEKRPPPDRSTLFEDVYQTKPWHLEEQAEELFGEDGGAG